MLWELTATNDGNRVAFMKRTAQRDVYIADVDQDGTATRARRLTLDDSDDFPASWTHDGASLFFTSNRNGSRDIFRQSLESRVPEAIVTGPEDEHGPMAVSPDGAWLYYLVSPRRPRGSTPSGTAVWRTALSGGARDRLTDDKLEHMALCARSPSAGCVLVERDGTDLSIYSLDPERGRGRKITSTPAAATVQAAISPDGSQVAVLMPTERRIRVVSLAGTQSRDVPIAARLDDSPLYLVGRRQRMVRVQHNHPIPGRDGTAARRPRWSHQNRLAPDRPRLDIGNPSARRSPYRAHTNEHDHQRLDAEKLLSRHGSNDRARGRRFVRTIRADRQHRRRPAFG